VNHTVTVDHSPELLVTLFYSTLENAGYELDSIHTDPRSPEASLFADIDLENGIPVKANESGSSWPLSFLKRSTTNESLKESLKRKRHVEHCDLCQNAKDAADQDGYTYAYDKKMLRAPSAFSVSTAYFVPHENPVLPTNNPLLHAAAVDEHDVNPANADGQIKQVQMSISGMTCSACVSSITSALQQHEWIVPESINVNLVGNSATMQLLGEHEAFELVELMGDLGYDATIGEAPPLVTTQQHIGTSSTNFRDLWKSIWAIGGMTCSACVGTIKTSLEDIPWVNTVGVNLVGNSATIIFEGKDNLEKVKEAVEDLGYDATLNVFEEITENTPVGTRRSVAFRITGMYCERCPPRIAEALEDLEGVVIVEKLPSMKNPILYVDYVPDAPRLTIRTILSSIGGADAALEVSTYHPPTIEERSRRIHAREQELILARVGLTLVLAIPTFVIGIVYMNLTSESNHTRMYLMTPSQGVATVEWILLALASPVYFFAADLFHRRTLKELQALWRPRSNISYVRRFLRFGSMNMLVSLGTSIAYWSSIGVLIASAARPRPGVDNTKDFYFDSVVFLTLFLLCGRLMEAYSKAKTADAVAMLGKLRPGTALLVTNSQDLTTSTIQTVSIDLLEINDTIRIPLGSSPPFDGIITSGSTILDESSLTGESKPVSKTIGDTVFAGTINTGAAISMRLKGVVGNSMLDQIIRSVREGQARRAPVERLVDRITGHFVPVVTLISIITWLAWMALGLGGALPADYLDTQLGGWPYWSLQFAIAVFVVACPCGIGLAAPTALFVGGGLAAKYGILVKGGGEAFQEASKVDVVVFDKTGTLTVGGEPKVVESRFVIASGNEDSGLSRAELLGMVKRLEEDSGHPVARAVVAWCGEEDIIDVKLQRSNEVVGKGTSGTFVTLPDSVTTDVLVGNAALLQDHSVEMSSQILKTISTWSNEARSIVLIAARSSSIASLKPPYRLRALLATADPIRPEAASIISTLQKSHGISVYMLTGDNVATATAVGKQVGISPSNIIAGVLPEQKAEKVRGLQETQLSNPTNKTSTLGRFMRGRTQKNRRNIVAFIGDGTNDAPALSAVDVSIAMSHSSGSDVAIGTASFVLLSSDLNTLLTLLRLSKAVMRRIMLNFGWALVYNCVGVPVAAGAFYGVRTASGGHVRLAPVWAALAMALSSVSVVGSSLLLRTNLPVVGFRRGS